MVSEYNRLNSANNNNNNCSTIKKTQFRSVIRRSIQTKNTEDGKNTEGNLQSTVKDRA
jgi:hypothetical protein